MSFTSQLQKKSIASSTPIPLSTGMFGGRSVQRQAATDEDAVMMQRQVGMPDYASFVGNDPRGGAVQAKLTVGAPNDQYEQEADRVADQVMSTPDSAIQQPVQREAMPEEEEAVQMKPIAATITPLVQREAMPEGEDVQAKPIGTLQREEAMPEEEELQMKPIGDSIQREEIPEETEELQMKPIATLQREEMPEEEEEIQMKRSSGGGFEAGGDFESRLGSSKGGGSPLPDDVRSFMEPRFGADFGGVRVHTGGEAVQMNREVNAQAFVHGKDVYFGAGKGPGKDELTAHELTHVVQQIGDVQTKISAEQTNLKRKCSACETEEKSLSLKPLLQSNKENFFGRSAKQPACKVPEHCPPSFCTPYSDRWQAEYFRMKFADILLLGIGSFISPSVVPLWSQHLYGGSAHQNLSMQFGKDFTNSPTTATTTKFLVDTLGKDVETNPPSFPDGINEVILDIRDQPRTKQAIEEIGTAKSPNEMNFNVIRDIPGNLAGGIGADETSAPVGAQPSPLNDARTAFGTIRIVRITDNTLFVQPSIKYTVNDTIDLCPGDCGQGKELAATIPMSRMEASGISGDVPFSVDFVAPPIPSRTITVNPPQSAPSQPIPHQSDSQFRSHRFAGQPTLEALID